MPLIPSPSVLAASEILDTACSIAGYLAVAAQKMDSITARLLSLDDENLAAFCNALGPVELNSVLTRHAETGAAINLALSQVNVTLAESGRGTIAGGVDVRPLSDKLEAQGRTLVVDTDTGKFVVEKIVTEQPPEPQMGGEPEEPEEPSE